MSTSSDPRPTDATAADAGRLGKLAIMLSAASKLEIVLVRFHHELDHAYIWRLKSAIAMLRSNCK